MSIEKSKLFLASGSERRRDLLSEWGYVFDLIPNLLEHEYMPQTGTMKSIYLHLNALSLRKARASAKFFKGIVLSADTVVICNRHILGKPRDLVDAKRMLGQLSGRWHRVVTSVTLLDTQRHRHISFSVTTHVQFRPLSESMITSYCDQYPVLDKAGSYAIQDIGESFVLQIMGSRSNVIGLPEHPLSHYLSYFGLERR